MTLPSTLILLIALSTSVSATCKNFTQSRDYYTTSSNTSQIISQGFVCDVPNSNSPNTASAPSRCNATTQCPVSSSGIINAIGTNNLSLSAGDVEHLYTLIPQHTTVKPTTFLYSLSGNVGSSRCLDAPTSSNASVQAGWFAFTPIFKCIEGTLSQCSNGPVLDATTIKLCAVDTYGTAQNPSPNGVEGFVMSDVQSARGLTSNPAATREKVKTVPSLSGAKGRVGVSGKGVVLGVGAVGLWLIL